MLRPRISTSRMPKESELLLSIDFSSPKIARTIFSLLTPEKQQLEIELSETDRALAELDKISDQTSVYKSVGSLLLKSERQTVLSELKERKELLGTRITVLGRQEERTKERMKELQTKLQEKLRPASPASS